MKTYFLYIMSNETTMIYVGVTNSLKHRVAQHKKKLVAGFTHRSNVHKPVHYECFSDIRVAIGREKQIKGWLRTKKVGLIVSKNPAWNDLSAAWFTTELITRGKTKLARDNQKPLSS